MWILISPLLVASNEEPSQAPAGRESTCSHLWAAGQEAAALGWTRCYGLCPAHKLPGSALGSRAPSKPVLPVACWGPDSCRTHSSQPAQPTWWVCRDKIVSAGKSIAQEKCVWPSQPDTQFICLCFSFFLFSSSDKSALSKAGSGVAGHPFPLANLVFHLPWGPDLEVQCLIPLNTPDTSTPICRKACQFSLDKRLVMI